MKLDGWLVGQLERKGFRSFPNQLAANQLIAKVFNPFLTTQQPTT